VFSGFSVVGCFWYFDEVLVVQLFRVIVFFFGMVVAFGFLECVEGNVVLSFVFCLLPFLFSLFHDEGSVLGFGILGILGMKGRGFLRYRLVEGEKIRREDLG